MNNCFISELILKYEVGYTCELHNKKYIDTCDLMFKKFMLKMQILSLLYIVDEENHIYLNEEKLKQFHDFSLDNLNNEKNYIKHHLYKRYLYMKEFNLKNIKIIKSMILLLINEII